MTDDDEELLAERFEQQRSHLRAVAYQMLGSVTEAEDAVQEAWLRLSRADTSGVEHLAGWLTTVVARVCLNMLRSRTRHPQQALGLQMPEPIVTQERLLTILHPDVVLRSDGGPGRPLASMVVHGARAVAHSTRTFARLSPYVRHALVNGTAGVVVAPRGRPYSVMGFTIVNGKIATIDVLADPARMRQLDLTVLD